MVKRIVFLTIVLLFVLGAVCSAEETGSLKGTITWQYNNYVGTKGDVEARIDLIPKNFDKNTISIDDEKHWYMLNKAPKDTNIFSVKADGYGNYEINGIPAGEYLVLIVSNKAKRNIMEPVPNYIKNTLSLYVRDWKTFELFVLSTGKIEIRDIEIKPNVMQVVSNDFGNTYF